MGSTTRVQMSIKAVCVSLHANAYVKGMNLFILPSPMGK